MQTIKMSRPVDCNNNNSPDSSMAGISYPLALFIKSAGSAVDFE
jgi:hypothetical protein